MPSEWIGTDSVVGIAICDWSFKTAMFLFISPSLRGALTDADPK